MGTKEKAVALYLEMEGYTPEDIHASDFAPERFEAEGQDLLVLTADEADEAWEESLDCYLEECIYPDLPEVARRYFDGDAWKRDARFDGRGHALSSYDGSEHEFKVDGEYIYVYRV